MHGGVLIFATVLLAISLEPMKEGSCTISENGHVDQTFIHNLGLLLVASFASLISLRHSQLATT